MRPDFWVVQTFNGLSYDALLFLLASGLSRPRSGAQRTGCSAHDPARGPGSYTHRDTLRPVAAYLDSGRSVPTTTNGGFETPMCPIGASDPNRDTLQEVAGIVVLCRPAYPVVEF